MERRTFLGLSGDALLGSTLLRSRQNQESTPDDEWRLAKVDLHSHLRHGGGQPMADRYAELGFDALVGTDHHSEIGVDGDVDDETVGDDSDLSFPGPILDGVELSNDHHVCVIESENETVKQINHPMRYDDTAEDINELALEIGADLVEVTDHGRKLDEYPTVAEAVEELKPTPTITSDAHAVDEVGVGNVVIEVPDLTGDDILRSLKDGRYSLSRDW
ncbi:PHP-associated domain-containing protein [Halorussus litoreus]|uniref:PHP-associated domain-containing protein n=1 Tax=Halorussus litoreus TaxID=1710536 RepID=UPI0013007A12|nr:PHP-associated domain-containing protein [Halorussus litoreus]